MQSQRLPTNRTSSPDSASLSDLDCHHAHASESTPLLNTVHRNMTIAQPQSCEIPASAESDNKTYSIKSSADARLTSRTGFLAGQSSSLASELHKISDACGHESTRRDISSVAEELSILSTVLWTVQESMNEERDKFSSAFNEDLTQITTELGYCYEEITECCISMQNTDNPVATVPWFFKKGRTHRLTKHLEALKATLITMRYVLWQSRDTVKGAHGHVMANNRYIIESIFDRNRDAILNVQALQKVDAELEKENLAGKKGSALDYFSIKDAAPDYTGLPALDLHDEQREAANGVFGSEVDSPSTSTGLARRFTKRVPLQVHTSIANMKSDEMSTRLIKKWSHNHHGLTSTRQIQSFTAHAEPVQGAPITDRGGTKFPTQLSSFNTEADVDLEANDPALSRSKKHRNNLLASPLGWTMKNVIEKLSLSKANERVTDHPEQVRRACRDHGVRVHNDNKKHAVGNDSPPYPCPPGCNHTGTSQREHPSKGRFNKFLEFFFGEFPTKSPLQTPDFYDTQGGQQSGR